MHSAQLCVFGIFQRQRSLAGSGREAFHAAHNFRAFGKSGRGFLAVHWQGVKGGVKSRASVRILVAQAHSMFSPVVFRPQNQPNAATRRSRCKAQETWHREPLEIMLRMLRPHTTRSQYRWTFQPHRPSLLFITAYCA